jgi:nucleoside-diphosphate-sugar epimerase
MANTRAVFRYRIRNWRAYNRTLINRGRLTIWFDEQGVAAWHHTEPAAEQVRHQQLPIVGHRHGVWSFVHVEDAARATVVALTAQPGVSTLGSVRNLPNLYL